MSNTRHCLYQGAVIRTICWCVFPSYIRTEELHILYEQVPIRMFRRGVRASPVRIISRVSQVIAACYTFRRKTRVAIRPMSLSTI